MKRLALLLAGSFLLIANVSFSQGIDDRAVIPVAVTLNSILRLNVVSGGNIEFNFNTLNDYTNGINTSAGYQTQFTVASSVNWNVNMYAEDANMVGTDIVTAGANNANVMLVDNIGYHVTSEGSYGNNFDFASNNPAAPVALDNTTNSILVGYDNINSNAGDVTANRFTIHWRCGTSEGGGMNGQSILQQAIAADRYATNVFLVLEPAI